MPDTDDARDDVDLRAELRPELRAELTDHERQLVEAHQARLAAELATFFEALGEIERTEPSLGGGSATGPGGRPIGDLADALDTTKPGFDIPHEELLGRLPSNSDGAPVDNAGPSEQGGAREDAAAARPSSDPRAWMSGAASQSVTTVDPDTGIKETRSTTENESGSTTTTTTAFNPANGDTTTTSTTRDSSGRRTTYIIITDHADGTSEGESTFSNRTGSTQQSWARDANGNMTRDHWTITENGRVTDEYDRDPRDRSRRLRMPREDETSDLARRLGQRFSHGKKAPPPEIDKVNPGDPDDSPPPAPRINPGDSIVVNPGGPAASGGKISRERAASWRQRMRDKVGGLVNPPGPKT